MERFFRNNSSGSRETELISEITTAFTLTALTPVQLLQLQEPFFYSPNSSEYHLRSPLICHRVFILFYFIFCHVKILFPVHNPHFID